MRPQPEEERAEIPLFRIAPVRGLNHPDLVECWHNRELFRALVWRDLAVRYQHTALGVAWVVIQPLATMLVLALIMGTFAHVPSPGVPYCLIAFCGLLAWTLNSRGLNEGSRSLLVHEELLKKVYFPRLFIPATPVASALVDVSIMTVALLVTTLAVGLPLGPHALLLPVFLAMSFLLALSTACLFSACDLLYRDVRHLIPFIGQMWFFLSPVIYPSSLVPPAWRWLYNLNPIVAVVDGIRWSLLGSPPPAPGLIAESIAGILLIGAIGTYVFRAIESTMADTI